MRCVFLLFIVGLVHGFLLDNGNSSSQVGKTTFLTLAQYYTDQSKTHSDIEKVHQDLEAYRTKEENILNLLAVQYYRTNSTV